MSALVIVAKFTNIHEAYLAQGVLESNGIPVFVDNQHSFSIEPSAYATLRVRESDVEEAVRLLQTLEFAQLREKSAPGSNANGATCPNCKVPIEARSLLARVQELFFRPAQRRCNNCGFSFSPFGERRP